MPLWAVGAGGGTDAAQQTQFIITFKPFKEQFASQQLAPFESLKTFVFESFQPFELQFAEQVIYAVTQLCKAESQPAYRLESGNPREYSLIQPEAA